MKKRTICLKCCQKADKSYNRHASRLTGWCEICEHISTIAEVGEAKFQEYCLLLKGKVFPMKG